MGSSHKHNTGVKRLPKHTTRVRGAERRVCVTGCHSLLSCTPRREETEHYAASHVSVLISV